jgi:hypothetical protein
MLSVLKRYTLALVFLLLVILLMLLGTLGVTSFADKMSEDMDGIHLKPRGEKLNK